MADKRYQVFISSTFTDLVKERAKLIEELMNANCIPAGMELFPATNDEQFAFIQTVIDDSDYVVLILAGKYGSLASDGKSYTEKEYDYAVKHGKTVIALLHEDPSVFTAKADVDKSAAEKLAAFREKVKTGRVIKHWKTEADIVGATLSGVNHAIRTHEAVGWVRGDQAITVDSLREVNALQKRNTELEAEIHRLRGTTQIPDLVELSDTYELPWRESAGNIERSKTITWGEIVARIAIPLGMSGPRDYILNQFLHDLTESGASFTKDTAEVLQATLQALGIIDLGQVNAYVTWHLTPRGRAILLSLRAARKPKPPSASA